MKKRKLKQFFKENACSFAFTIWLFLVSITISFLPTDFPVQLK